MNENDPNVLAYLHSYKGRRVLVMPNMTAAARTVHLAVEMRTATPLLASCANCRAAGGSDFALDRFGAYIAELR